MYIYGHSHKLMANFGTFKNRRKQTFLHYVLIFDSIKFKFSEVVNFDVQI